MNDNQRPVLVIGGGVAGMTAAVEIAEVGYPVVLVEREAWLGGRVVRAHRYFPKMCPPTCGYEINVRRIRTNPRITVHTLATVEDVQGRVGNFRIRIRVRPRFVTGDPLSAPGVAEALSSERPDEFELGLKMRKALYLPHPAVWPHRFLLDREALTAREEEDLLAAAPEGTIDLLEEERVVEIEAAAVILATGWQSYDATRLGHLGFGKLPDVVTNVMMERLAAPTGPTGGEVFRPSDGRPPGRVAFVQCAGSRDENHLPYCSAVCCMASLKQARYVREKVPDAEITIYYIDVRTIGREEKFYFDLLEDERVRFVKGKVARVEAGSAPGTLRLDVEDTIAGERLHEEHDLVVLATGVVPSDGGAVAVSLGLEVDDHGFATGVSKEPGIFAAGCSRRPADVSRVTKDATSVALKAIQVLTRGVPTHG